MSEESESTLSPDDLISEEHSKLDVHLRLLIQQNHPRIMNLEIPIPAVYPWEEFLKRHFAQPPFQLGAEDYECIIVGKSKILRIRDSRKPTTFYSLLRFLEFFRSNLETLQHNLSRIEEKHDRLRNTANEKTGLRAILKNNDWNYQTISNKHAVVKEALTQRASLDVIRKKLESILSQNHNVTSKWQYLIQPFYKKAIEYINDNFQDGTFNLRMFYPVKTMEQKLAPHYMDSMDLAIELNDAVLQTAAVIKSVPARPISSYQASAGGE